MILVLHLQISCLLFTQELIILRLYVSEGILLITYPIIFISPSYDYKYIYCFNILYYRYLYNILN